MWLTVGMRKLGPILIGLSVILSIVGLTITGVGSYSPTLDNYKSQVQGTKTLPLLSTAQSGEMIDLTNSYRTEQGLSTLTSNDKLTVSAQTKADDICTNNYWRHEDSQGRPFDYFIQESGYAYSVIGENLAKGYWTMGDAFTGLLESPTHLENIVYDYEDIGVGVSGCGGKNYVVIHYGIFF